MPKELMMFLSQPAIACSRTSMYNTPENGQCERYIGIIWTAATKSCKLDIAYWECLLPDALHSIHVYRNEWAEWDYLAPLFLRWGALALGCFGATSFWR